MDAYERLVGLLRPRGSVARPITSHTLFGATCWALATLGQDVGALLDKFADRPLFAFGAAFPYIEANDGQPLPFLPCPALDYQRRDGANTPPGSPIEMSRLAKRLKKASLISAGVAEGMRTGTIGPDVPALVKTGKLVPVSGVLLQAAEAKALWPHGDPALPWSHAIVQRNSVDRMAGATAEGLLFQEQEVFFARRGPGPSGGLWFGAWVLPKYVSLVKAAFRYLADTGFGGERTVGKGHCDVRWMPWNTVFPKAPGDRALSLSTLIPGAQDSGRPLSYEVESIRQKVEHRYPEGETRVYLARIRAFRPGALWAGAECDGPWGRLISLGPVGSRLVRYSGLSIWLAGRWEVGYE